MRGESVGEALGILARPINPSGPASAESEWLDLRFEDSGGSCVSLRAGERGEAPDAPTEPFVTLAVDSDALVYLTRGQSLALVAWLERYFHDH